MAGQVDCCDPAGLMDGTNCYTYARDNPVTLRDPLGTQAEDSKNLTQVKKVSNSGVIPVQLMSSAESKVAITKALDVKVLKRPHSPTAPQLRPADKEDVIIGKPVPRPDDSLRPPAPEKTPQFVPPIAPIKESVKPPEDEFPDSKQLSFQVQPYGVTTEKRGGESEEKTSPRGQIRTGSTAW